MPRPCECGRCRLCWLAANDPRYAALWGLPPPTGTPPAEVRRGLGDWVAAVLAFFGVTKERVAKATGKPACGCAARQQRLNEFGKKLGIGG